MWLFTPSVNVTPEHTLNICTYHQFINLVHRGQITCFVMFCEKLRNDYKYCHIFMGHQKPF